MGSRAGTHVMCWSSERVSLDIALLFKPDVWGAGQSCIEKDAVLGGNAGPNVGVGITGADRYNAVWHRDRFDSRTARGSGLGAGFYAGQSGHDAL